MRIFQSKFIYPAHARLLRPALKQCASYAQAYDVLLGDYPKAHVLEPVMQGREGCRAAFISEPVSQGLWARDKGMPSSAKPAEILLAQIEEDKPDVFYNGNATQIPVELLARMPGCVKHKIVWHASPIVGDYYRHYDLVVCNFPDIMRQFEERGCTTKYFFPAHDPFAEEVVSVQPTEDVVFSGGYTRHHKRRNRIFEKVASDPQLSVSLYLDPSRMTRLAESPAGWIGPLKSHRRPEAIRRATKPAVFGRDLYRTLAGGRIVLNASIDMAGKSRGNLRCFEALSCGRLLLSDAGDYVDGFEDGETMIVYRDADDAIRLARQLLEDEPRRQRIAAAGHEMIRRQYSKERQMAAFTELF